MSSSHEGLNAALANAASEIVRVADSAGPFVLAVKDLEGQNVVLSVSKKSDGSLVALEEDTAVASEDTLWNGDTTTLDFATNAPTPGDGILDNTPIVPGSVTIAPTAGGDSVNATDRDGDGKLYTSDVDEDYCGTIDYFTGAANLFYPSGKAPNTGAILAHYTYSEICTANGQKAYHINNLVPGSADEALIVKAAGADNTRVKVEAIQVF
jgi:hypothetical protein